MSLFVDMLQHALPDVPARKQMTSHVTTMIITMIIGAEVAISPMETSVLVSSTGFLITITINTNVYLTFIVSDYEIWCRILAN